MSVYTYRDRIAYCDVAEGLLLNLRGAMRIFSESAVVHSCAMDPGLLDKQKNRRMWMIASWRVRMIGEALWNQNVVVKTWVTGFSRVTMKRCCEMYTETGELVAAAETDWIYVNLDTARAAEIPPEIRCLFSLEDRMVFDEPLPGPDLDEGEETYHYFVHRRDLDTNRHVNNLFYVDYSVEAMPEEYWFYPFREITVSYLRQLLRGHEVHCIYQKGDGCHRVDFRSADCSYSHAVVTLYE